MERLHRLRHGAGQAHGDPCPLAPAARQRDAAAVRLDDRPRHREPESGALGGAPACLRAAVEALEDVVQLLGWDTDAGVGDRDRGLAALLAERVALGMWRLRRAERVERGVLVDRLLGLEEKRAERDRRRHERTFADGLAALDTSVTDPAAHAEATARLDEAAALREEALPTLGAAFARAAAGPGGGLDLVGRYEAAAERGLLRALRELRALRAARNTPS